MNTEKAAEKAFEDELRRLPWWKRSAFKSQKVLWIHGFVCGCVYSSEKFAEKMKAAKMAVDRK